MLVFDATPLIYLAKSGKLKRLEKFKEEKIIPKEVYEEVVIEGKRIGESDAQVIEKEIEKGTFEVKRVEKGKFYKKLSKVPNLSKADKKVLALAYKESGKAILDEDYARSVAELEGIKNRGSIYLLFRLLKQGEINVEEVKRTVNKMVEEGWYCSTDLYSQILIELKKFKK